MPDRSQSLEHPSREIRKHPLAVEVGEQRVIRARVLDQPPVRMSRPGDEPPAPVRRHHPVRRAVLHQERHGEPAGAPPAPGRSCASPRSKAGRCRGDETADRPAPARRPPGRATGPSGPCPSPARTRGQTRDSTRPSARSGAGTPSAPSGGRQRDDAAKSGGVVERVVEHDQSAEAHAEQEQRTPGASARVRSTRRPRSSRRSSQASM